METVNADQNMRPGNRHQAQAVEVYDFRRPTTLAREHSRVLELAFESFARQWGTQLSAKVRGKSTVVNESVAMLTYDEYVSSLPGTTTMVLAEVQGTDSKAVLQFPITSVLSWIIRQLGGNGSQKPPLRKLTPVEHALVSALASDALADLQYSLGGLMAAHGLRVASIQDNSQFAQAAATTDLMIVAMFTVSVGEDTCEASVALPADVILQQLGALNPMDTESGAAGRIRGQLGEVPVAVGLRLRSIQVKPGLVLGLKTGDVIPLPHQRSEPLYVSVEEHPLYRAAVGSNGSRLAAAIVSTEEHSK